MVTAGLLAIMLLADAGAAPSADAPDPNTGGPAPAAAQAPAPGPELAPPPGAAPVEPEPEPEPPPHRRPRYYGDRGTADIGVGLGYSRLIGFVGAGTFRYFVIDGVAPGVEATYVSGGTSGAPYGLLLGALRVVPLRTGSFALALTGRAGRVLLGDHADGWGAGGAASVLVLFAPNAGLELGYQALWLYPSSFCADLSSCVIQGPVIGLRFGLGF
jgi:hypothetical protein